MYDYQINAVNKFLEYVDVNGAHILEVGGAPPFDVAKHFVNLGCAAVEVINLRTDIQNGYIAPNIVYQAMDASLLSYKDQSFDAIFGVAVLEHISNINGVVTECERVLRPGGHLFIHGAPLWTAPNGHHLWLKIDEISYEFNGNNPIPPFAHLYLSKDEMECELLKNNIPSLHIPRIISDVFSRQFINRFHPKQYQDAVINSGLIIKQYALNNWTKRGTSISDRIKLGNPSISCIDGDELTLVMQKPLN